MDSQSNLQHEPVNWPYTAEEAARLEVYKAAVEAGFYTDDVAEPGSSETTFTPAQLSRLATYRAAIQAGFYTDFFEQGGDAEARTHPMR
jgi:hypothetical protein